MKLSPRLALGFLVVSAAALAETPGVEWLQKISSAARTLNYSGTFVYQYGDQVETSRIWHYVEDSQQFEKLETMDGPAREVIRTNDEVLCYYPDSKTVRIQKRRARAFPALLPEQINGITESYTVRLGDRERIAGYEAQAVILEPRDGLRYGHKFWADVSSGLLVKARTMNERKEMVEQFAFTSLQIGGNFDKEALKPKRMPGWNLDATALAEPATGDTGWVVTSYPAGFRKIMESKRIIPGRPSPVSHIVYSDGLAAVSIFIEPLEANKVPLNGVSHQGAINVYTGLVANNMVTVLGEAPTETVVQIGKSIAARK